MEVAPDGDDPLTTAPSTPPFDLDASAADWVRRTIRAMSDEEKVGQLFVYLFTDRTPSHLKGVVDRYRIGGVRYGRGTAQVVQDQNRFLQSVSKVPLLIAANVETGGSGASSDGTLVGSAAQLGAVDDVGLTERAGRVAGKEAAAVGCNWAFAPVVDLHLNWRNTVVSTRSFGADPEHVARHASAYMRGLRSAGLACAMKHFPGDGVDERDQHLVTTRNSLEHAEWKDSYGRVFSRMISEKIESVMVGHISLPGHSGSELPATLSDDLVTGLLRKELGFDGLVVTDATMMGGYTAAMKRRDALPLSIQAGCDMLLFTRDPAEDFDYVLSGLERGLVSEERVDEALARILSLKASIGLHGQAHEEHDASQETSLQSVGCTEHLDVAREVAERSITLFRDADRVLPVTPANSPRAAVYLLGDDVPYLGLDQQKILRVVVEELCGAGFDVSPQETFEEMRSRGAGLEAALTPRSDLDWFDVVFVFANVRGFAQDLALQCRWPAPMAPDIPGIATELPVVFVSLSEAHHLYAFPALSTAVHAYTSSRDSIRAAVRKITGDGAFHGTYHGALPPDRLTSC